jgi:hypothetical protein
MNRLIITAGFLALTFANLAQATTPNNINVNCHFKAEKSDLRCHAVANLHIQGAADDHLLVNCPGHGNATIVYNNDAEVSANDVVVSINPKGDAQVPALLIAPEAFACHQTPVVVDGVLALPDSAPYNGAQLEGRCHVVTAGCSDNQ